MADGKTEDLLNPLSFPALTTDNLLVGRGTDTFRAPRNRVVTLGPRVSVNRPQAADFPTWVNQGGATITDLSDGVLLHGPQGAGDNLRLRVRALPSTSAFDVVLGCVRGFPHKNFLSGGLLLRESATGKIETASFNRPGVGYVASTQWSNPTTFVNAIRTWDNTDSVMFFRFKLAGSTINDYFSPDGVTWIPFDPAGHSKTAFFTTGPDQYGFFVNATNQATPNFDTDLSVFHFSE